MQAQDPAHPDKTRQSGKIHPGLSIAQEHAIDLLMQGKRDLAVAGAIGATRQTICEWRNHNPTFSAELDRRRQVMWGSHFEQLRRLAGKAIQVLEDDLAIEGSQAMLTEAERRVRQRAALHILKASGLLEHSPRPTAEITGEDQVTQEFRKEVQS